MPDLAPLLALVTPGFFQQAFIVADLGAAQGALRATLGCREFVELPAMDLEYDVRGTVQSCALHIGFARSGDVQIELIEPVRGPSIHAEFLAARGAGAHHFGYLVDSLDTALATADECGLSPIMRGGFGALRFAYVDTFAALGVFTELVEDPDGLLMQMCPWRD